MILTQKSLALAARELAARDEILAGIHAKHGDPPLWRRATGFTTLAHIILEQQVSLKSAKAMLVRLESKVQPFAPERFLELGDAHLRGLGVTRQKSAYLIDLSTSIVNGDLSFAKLARTGLRHAKRNDPVHVARIGGESGCGASDRTGIGLGAVFDSSG